MKKFAFLFFFMFCASAFAGNLIVNDSDLIKEAGIPIYKNSTFVYGNKDVGFRFASKDSPEKIRQWYRENLSKWSLFEEYGSWLLYDGKPGLGMGGVMSTNQVSIQKNDQLPTWYSLDKNMTTEIVIMVPK